MKIMLNLPIKRKWLDMIERGEKREKAAIEADALAAGGIVEAGRRETPGNAAAMRAALEKCLHYLTGETELVKDEIIALCDVMNAALAAPPRNCDRGTPQEQAKRFVKYCQNIAFKSSCSGCPLNDNNEDPSCFNLWAQMPYKEGVAK